jgi:hypothetical protein
MPSPAKNPATASRKSTKGAATATAATETAAPVRTKNTSARPAVLTPAERMKMIAEAAYFLAEKRGFSGGSELADWVAAEKQVDAEVAKRG